ncbi:unnamed protein product [Sphagnum balticum]
MARSMSWGHNPMVKYQRDKRYPTEVVRTEHLSIHPYKRNPKTKQRRAANHAKNKRVRADLYSSLQGEAASRQAGKWHETLKH